jgi:hypothetical protein
VIRGVGRDANPIDGDRVVIELGVSDGKLAYIGAEGIRTGTLVAMGEGASAFAGCETARRAALVLPTVFIDRSIEEGLAVSVGDLISRMGGAPADNERCVLTVLGAVRSALIDAHVATLAEATVEAKRMRIK